MVVFGETWDNAAECLNTVNGKVTRSAALRIPRYLSKTVSLQTYIVESLFQYWRFAFSTSSHQSLMLIIDLHAAQWCSQIFSGRLWSFSPQVYHCTACSFDLENGISRLIACTYSIASSSWSSFATWWSTRPTRFQQRFVLGLSLDLPICWGFFRVWRYIGSFSTICTVSQDHLLDDYRAFILLFLLDGIFSYSRR